MQGDRGKASSSSCVIGEQGGSRKGAEWGEKGMRICSGDLKKVACAEIE